MIDPAILSRTFQSIPKIMYHGTSSENYYSLVEGIDISNSRKSLDFGRGFYLTSNFEQASRHAEKRSKNTKPIVFVYKVNLQLLKQSYGKVFYKMDLEWAEFIYKNRSLTKGFVHSFDHVYGGVADGFLDDLIDDLDSGVIDINLFYHEIAKYSTYDQLSINNQQLISYGIMELIKVVNAYAKASEYTG
jgi:hypothetical protein